MFSPLLGISLPLLYVCYRKMRCGSALILAVPRKTNQTRISISTYIVFHKMNKDLTQFITDLLFSISVSLFSTPLHMETHQVTHPRLLSSG